MMKMCGKPQANCSSLCTQTMQNGFLAESDRSLTPLWLLQCNTDPTAKSPAGHHKAAACPVLSLPHAPGVCLPGLQALWGHQSCGMIAGWGRNPKHTAKPFTAAENQCSRSEIPLVGQETSMCTFSSFNSPFASTVLVPKTHGRSGGRTSALPPGARGSSCGGAQLGGSEFVSILKE